MEKKMAWYFVASQKKAEKSQGKRVCTIRGKSSHKSWDNVTV